MNRHDWVEKDRIVQMTTIWIIQTIRIYKDSAVKIETIQMDRIIKVWRQDSQCHINKENMDLIPRWADGEDQIAIEKIDIYI